MYVIKKMLLAAVLAAPLWSGAATAAETVRIGLIPAEDSQAMIESSQLVLDQLAEKLGMEVEPFVATDYNGIIEALRSKRLDVAYLGPFSYVLANQIADVEAFAVAVTQKANSSAYRSQIVVRNDSGIESVAELKDKTFAFVDPSSASGHLFPNAGLQQAGYQPEELFSRIIFSGSHDASLLAVVHEKVDAAAVADRIYSSAISKELIKADDLKVIWSSDAIPESPMVWRKDLDPALKEKLSRALADIKDVPWGDQGLLNGFQPTNDAAYDVVRSTAHVLGLDLESLK